MISKLKQGIWISLIMMLVLTGCGSGQKDTASGAFDPKEPVVLKVAYFNEQSFYQTYGNVFSAKYPNVTFEVIPTIGNANTDAVERITNILDEQKPDIVILSMEEYEALATDGRLYDLESAIKQSGFDLNGMVGGVVELLRDAGGGKLYGLAPTFSTDALYYNKDLFAKYGIPEPTDHMTWEQVLELAARFPTDGEEDARIYGLANSMMDQNSFGLIQKMAAAKGLNYLNGDATALTMDAPEWKEVFQAFVEAYKSQTVLKPGSSPSGSSGQSQLEEGGGMTVRFNRNDMLFLSGRAAMTIDNSSMINMMDMSMFPGQNGRGENGGRQALNWGIVTAPVDQANPDMTSTYQVSQIFAVNAASSKTDAAWAFIQYVHSDEAAQIRSRTSTELQSRVGFNHASNGQSLEAFYKLHPMRMEVTRWYPRGFRAAFQTIATEEINAAVSGSKSIDDAFQSLVSRGKEALAEANLSGEKEMGGSGPNVRQIFIGR